MIDQWAHYGILGLVIIGLGSGYIRLEKAHRAERKEWKETTEKQFQKMDDRDLVTNQVMRENTGALQGLKTLLENSLK